MNFAAFIFLNAVLFLRPAEVLEGLAGVPFYSIALLACLALNLPGLARQLAPEAIAARPVSACIIAMVPAVALSQLWQGDLRAALAGAGEFAMVLLYYMLLVGSVTSAGRLRSLLGWAAILIGLTSALAILDYHGAVDLPAFRACEERDYDGDTGDVTVVARIQATGLFNNPNALARIITFGMLASACRMADPKRRAAAPFWLGLSGLLGYALLMTKSRGGFLGLLAGLATLLAARLGVRRAIVPAAVMTAAILVLVGGRQTDLSTDEGTGRHRIEIWDAGLQLFGQSPAFGIGQNNYLERVGIVAHNSFVQAYVELGYPGGTLFVGTYGLAIAALWRLGADRDRVEEAEPGLARFRPFLMAILGAEVVGQLSITRTYTLSTYLPLGLSTAYLGLNAALPGVRTPRCTPRVLAAVAALGLAALAATFLYIRIKLR